MGQNGTRTIGDLKPSPFNPRQIDAERLRMLGDSMGEFGDLSGIVFNRRTGRLIGGHQRIKHIPESATIEIDQRYEEPTQAGTVAEGFVEMAGERWVYREVDVDETREAAMNVAANKHGGEFEFGSLAELLSELDAGGFDMPLTGFTDEELEGLLVRDDVRGVDDADLTPPEEPKSKRGEIYELGPHRLMCGDATSEEDVAALLDGAEPRLMVTDPPYGVEYDAAWREEAGVSTFGPQRAAGGIQGDAESDWTPVWKSSPADVAYVWHGGLHASTVQMSLESAGYDIRSQVVWVKPRFVLSRGHYHWQHEPCWYAVRKGASANWSGDRKQVTTWEIDSLHVASRKEEPVGHGTQKPLECMARPIANHAGDVYDPFGGSGTTLMAATEHRRTCYMMEIDPRYCDVIRRRYATYVGDESLMP